MNSQLIQSVIWVLVGIGCSYFSVGAYKIVRMLKKREKESAEKKFNQGDGKPKIQNKEALVHP